MKKLFSLTFSILICITGFAQEQSDYVPIKELFKGHFLAGVAVGGGRDYSGDMVRTAADRRTDPAVLTP